MEEIAKRVKKTRDAGFTLKNDKGQVVNRTVFAWRLAEVRPWTTRNAGFIRRLMRALGLVYIEHRARI